MTIVQCSICMAAMLHEFFSSQSNWPVKLPARADRMLQRWHMAGFSSPLLANFPDCMKIQSGFFLRRGRLLHKQFGWPTPETNG